MQRIEVNGLVYEFEDDMSLMSLLDENADRVYEGIATEEAPPNDPLTLEELREMDGKPVYDRMGYGWFIVCEVTDDEVIMTDGTVFDIDEDSPNTVGQRFYRRKPEEGAP